MLHKMPNCQPFRQPLLYDIKLNECACLPWLWGSYTRRRLLCSNEDDGLIHSLSSLWCLDCRCQDSRYLSVANKQNSRSRFCQQRSYTVSMTRSRVVVSQLNAKQVNATNTHHCSNTVQTLNFETRRDAGNEKCSSSSQRQLRLCRQDTAGWCVQQLNTYVCVVKAHVANIKRAEKAT